MFILHRTTRALNGGPKLLAMHTVVWYVVVMACSLGCVYPGMQKQMIRAYWLGL